MATITLGQAFPAQGAAPGGNRTLLVSGTDGTALRAIKTAADGTVSISGAVTAADGGIASLGAKADAAVTDPTLSASEVALLKGLLKQLQGTGAGAAPVTLSGRNAADLAGRGKETLVYQYQSYSQGQIPASGTVTLCDVTGECHLEALTLASEYSAMAASIYPKNAAGVGNARLGIPNKSGTINDVYAGTIKANAGGENDFFRNFVYDDVGSNYVWGMKRQAVFNNGVAIYIKNWDSVNPHHVAAIAMVSFWR